MKTPKKLLAVLVASGLSLSQTQADERRFTYTYEPEVLPQGASEFEQWVTLRTQRTKDPSVQQENYNLWEIREEFEYGVTDWYSLSLYLNANAESYRDVSTSPATDVSTFEFQGIALENRFMILNPADHAIGLTLYFEPRFSGEELELEQKIIIGQRHGNWKWAFNLGHATEWKDNFNEVEGEVEACFGISWDLNKNWSLGLELRNHNEIPNYSRWENTAVFLGPAINYRQEKWWATLSILPQIYGANFGGDPDGHPNLELEGHERANIRLIVGISF